MGQIFSEVLILTDTETFHHFEPALLNGFEYLERAGAFRSVAPSVATRLGSHLEQKLAVEEPRLR
jgi:hypothetical protein